MKKLFYLLVFVVLLAVGAIFMLPLMLSSDSTRQALASRVSEMTGAQISLNGPVEFSVFPDLGLVASDLEFTLPSGELSASIPKMVAGVNLMPLLGGRVEITGLDLTRPHIIYNQPDASTETNPSPVDGSDPVAELVVALEKFALNNLTVSDGKFITRTSTGDESVISQINLSLKAPDLDGEILVKLDALNNGQSVSLNASLSALRPILSHKPADFSLAMKLAPAPHPALADVTASGKILLTDDQSYQIADGLFTSLGQPLRLDALYRGGERPYISFDLEADAVDLSSFAPTQTASKGDEKKSTGGSSSSDQPIDLSMLRQIDMDAAIAIGKLTMADAQVDNIDLQFSLENGILNANLGKAKIKQGILAAQLNSDFNSDEPTVSGKIIASRMNIGHLARLADVKTPLTGTLGVSLGYAFSGLSESQIRNSLNAAGKIVLVDANVKVPELKSFGKGDSAGNISALNAQIDITDLQQPLNATGSMVWNREPIKFSAHLSPSQFLEEKSGKLDFDIQSTKLNLTYKGRVGLDATANGAANISVASLDNLLNWLNLGGATGLKAFKYSGGVSLGKNEFALNKAKIKLDKHNITGSGSINFVGKPNIKADLVLGSIDLAEFTGGSSENTQNSTNDTVIDLSSLRSIDGDIKVRIAKLSHGKLRAGPVNARMTIKNGVGRLNIPKMSLYGGSLVADVTANGASKVSKLAINAKLNGVDSSSFLRDAEVFDRMEGKLNSDVDLQGAGNTIGQFAKSLGGTAKLKFLNGAVRGIDVAKLFNNVSSLTKGEFKENSSERTEFNELGMSMVVKDGVAKTNDLKLIGPVVTMDGAGQIDVGGETIAMRINPKVVGAVGGQGGKFDVSGIVMPIIVEGPLSKPRIYPDLSEVLKNPQVFMQSLSKLGIDLKSLGGGGLNIENVLKQGVGGLTGGSGSSNPAGQIGNVIGNILTQNTGGSGASNSKKAPSNPADLMGSLMGQFLNPGANKNKPTTKPSSTESLGTGDQNLADTQYGRVPIPIPNPGFAGVAQPAPQASKPVQTQIIEKVVDQVAPKLNLPVDNDVAKKTLENVFKQIFQ